MNQQRARRFRSAQEARENDEKKEELHKLLVKQGKKSQDEEMKEEVIQKTWDSNVITPGTPFMDILAASLRYWIAYKLNTDPAWEKVRTLEFFDFFDMLVLTCSDENYHFRCYCPRRRRTQDYGICSIAASIAAA